MNNRFSNCPGYPNQEFPMKCPPVHDNCNGGEPMGGAECGGAAPVGREPCGGTVVPPPIPPVRYIPGMNVQEQMCNMAERVNTAINRWNQIQGQCYKALDDVVGAAVSNDVYYTCDEVRYSEGYDEDSGCSYTLIEAKACDKSGKPIFCHLRPAYNNQTNSGARELITDVSFVTSAQVAMTAVQATETRWAGTSVFNCNPGNSTPDDTVWVCGWNRNGVLRFFRGDVSQDVLRQNRMVSCIGPVFPILKSNSFFTEVLDSMDQSPASIQAIGWKPNGNKVFFNCGIFDRPGMSPSAVAKIMQNIGCATAVICSVQRTAVSAWDASPIAGTEAREANEQSDGVISVPGMTGGLTFMGRLTAAPIQWSIPANCAAWVISKRPQRGWNNSFTSEVANIVQKMGNLENSMNSTLGQLQDENDAISKLQYDLAQNTQDVSELKQTVGGFDSRITGLETKTNDFQVKIDKNTQDIANLTQALQTEVTARTEADNLLTTAIQNEVNERKSADATLKSQLAQETSARESADRVLQSNIEAEANARSAANAALKADITAEANTRANADRNLQAAIEAEASARSTKDTQHEARMDAIEATEQKDKQELQEAIDNLKDEVQSGSALPLATTTTVGVVKVGKNLTVEADGTLNANASGGGGDEVVAGPGITVTENTKGQKVVGIDEAIVVNTDELKAATDAIDGRLDVVEQKQTDQAAKDALQDQKIEANETAISGVQGSVTTINTEITEITNKQDAIEQTVKGLEDGSGLPVASATVLGAVKVGANLSISEDGTLSASGGGEGGGETVAQGTGIAVEHNAETGVATVSLSADTQATLAQVENKADKTAVDALTSTVAGKADKTALANVKATADKAAEDAESATTEIENTLKPSVSKNTVDISALNSANTALTNRLDLAEKNIDAVSTQQATTNEDIEKLRTDLEAVDDTATAAMDIAATAEENTAKKVDKAGDTMTGTLTVSGSGGESKLTPYSVGFYGSNLVAIVGKRSRDGIDNIAFGAIAATDDADNNLRVTLRGVAKPTKNSDAASKDYVDAEIDKVEATAQAANVTANEANEAATAAQSAASEAQNSAMDASISASNALQKAEEAQTQVTGKVSKTGDTMTGALSIVPPEGSMSQFGTVLSNSRLEFNQSSGEGGMPVEETIDSIRLMRDGDKVSVKGSTQSDEIDSSSTVELKGVATPLADTSAANKKYVDDAVAGGGGGGDYLPLSGGTVGGYLTVHPTNSNQTLLTGTQLQFLNNSGSLLCGITPVEANVLALLGSTSGIKIRNVATPVSTNDAANKAYVDSSANTKLSKSGGTMTGSINMANSKITNLATPTSSADAATKSYVDSAVLGTRATENLNVTIGGVTFNVVLNLKLVLAGWFIERVKLNTSNGTTLTQFTGASGSVATEHILQPCALTLYTSGVIFSVTGSNSARLYIEYNGVVNRNVTINSNLDYVIGTFS